MASRLVVEFIANTAKFQADLAQATRSVDRSTRQMTASLSFLKGALQGVTGVLTVGTFVHLIKGSIDAADHLNDLSQQTGVSVESLSGLGLAARQSGTDLDSVAKAFGKLNLQIAAGAGGNEEAVRAFKAVGLSVSDLQKLKPEEIFTRIADRFSEWNDGANKAALGSKYFGKAYQEIIPLLNQGGDALRKSAEYAKKYGGVTTEVAQKADEFNDTLEKLKFVSGAFGRTLAADLLDPLQALGNAFVDAKEKGEGFGSFAHDTADVLKGIASVAVLVTTEISALGHAIGAIAAEAAALATLEFKRIGEIERLATADQNARFERMNRLLAAINNPPAASITPKKAGKGKTDAPSLGSADADDTAKRILDGQIKALENSVREEQDILKDREHFLQSYYQDGYLGIREYYARRQEVIDAALAAQVQALNEEQRLLSAAAATASPKDRIALETRVADVIAKRSKLEQDAAVKSSDLFIEQSRSAEQFRDKIEQVSIQLAQLRGDSVLATAANFDAANKELQNRLNLEKQSTDERERRLAEIGQRELDQLRALTVQQAQLNKEQERFSIIVSEISNAQSRIDIARNSGAITELEALRRTSEANRARIADLTRVAEAYEEIARVTGDPRAIAQADNLRLKIEELAAAGDLVAKKFNDVFASALTDALTDFATGAKSLRDIFKDMEKQIVGSISRIASQNISESLFGKDGPLSFLGKGLSGIFGSGKAFGSAPFNGDPKEAFSLGGAGGAAALTGAGTVLTTAGTTLTAAAATLEAAAASLLASSAADTASGIGDVFKGFGTFFDFGGAAANGGPLEAGKLHLVGERGPELFRPARSGDIVPTEVLQAKRAARGGDVHITVHVPEGTSRASATQIAAEVARRQQGATRRNL